MSTLQLLGKPSGQNVFYTPVDLIGTLFGGGGGGDGAPSASGFTKWTEFQELDMTQISECIARLSHPIVATCCNAILDKILSQGVMLRCKKAVFQPESKQKLFEEWWTKTYTPFLQKAILSVMAAGFFAYSLEPVPHYGFRPVWIDLDVMRIRYRTNGGGGIEFEYRNKRPDALLETLRKEGASFGEMTKRKRQRRGGEGVVVGDTERERDPEIFTMFHEVDRPRANGILNSRIFCALGELAKRDEYERLYRLYAVESLNQKIYVSRPLTGGGFGRGGGGGGEKGVAVIDPIALGHAMKSQYHDAVDAASHVAQTPEQRERIEAHNKVVMQMAASRSGMDPNCIRDPRGPGGDPKPPIKGLVELPDGTVLEKQNMPQPPFEKLSELINAIDEVLHSIFGVPRQLMTNQSQNRKKSLQHNGDKEDSAEKILARNVKSRADFAAAVSLDLFDRIYGKKMDEDSAMRTDPTKIPEDASKIAIENTAKVVFPSLISDEKVQFAVDSGMMDPSVFKTYFARSTMIPEEDLTGQYKIPEDAEAEREEEAADAEAERSEEAAENEAKRAVAVEKQIGGADGAAAKKNKKKKRKKASSSSSRRKRQ